MTSSLSLGTYGLKREFSELAFGCCPLSVGAVVLDRYGNALKHVSTDPEMWSLTPYVKTEHNNFCIPLNEHAQRSHYYYIDIEDGTYALTASLPGEAYVIEFWYRLNSSISFNRDNDYLIDTQKFKWDGAATVDLTLSNSQIDASAIISPVASIAYDKSNQIARILCWLQKNGGIVGDTKSALATWRTFNGELISQVEKYTYMADSDGVPIDGLFKFELPGIDLSPDNPTPLSLEIKDADDTPYENITSIVCYD